MNEIILEKDGLTLELHPDDTAPNPREEFDHLGTLVCWHRRYSNLGDRDNILGDSGDYSGWREVEKALRKHTRFFLPVYMLDHSGLCLSTDRSTFSAVDPAGWDWGQVGYIYVHPDDVRKDYKVKRITRGVTQKVLAMLRAEIEELDAWLSGDTWCFCVTDEDGNVLNSCSGYYGKEYAISDGRDTLESILRERERENG